MVLLLWADIKGALRSEYVVYYRCGDCMLYTAVTHRVLDIAVFSFMIVIAVDTIIFFVC